jgi:hypothetical protein
MAFIYFPIEVKIHAGKAGNFLRLKPSSRRSLMVATEKFPHENAVGQGITP